MARNDFVFPLILLGGGAVALFLFKDYIFPPSDGTPPPPPIGPPPPPGTEPVLTLTPTTAAPGDNISYTATGYTSGETVNILLETSVVTSSAANTAGIAAGTFTVPAVPDGVYTMTAHGTISNKTAAQMLAVAALPPPPPIVITEGNLPWGATLANLNSDLDVDMYVENNDIQFDLVHSGLEWREFHLIRVFDPTGLHVKDYTSSLSATDRQDIDVNAAQISNVAGICGACDYQGGRWVAVVLVSLQNFVQDTSKPLKYGPYTCVTEGMVVEHVRTLDIDI